MKSNVCKIYEGTKDLAAILKESEKVAVYNELDHKKTLQLRLLCEELDGMLPEVIQEFDGDLWFEFEDGVCTINVSIVLQDLDADKRDQLIAIAKNKKNAAAVGIVGKIRSALEDFFLDESNFIACNISSVDAFHLATGYSDGVDYSYIWSLEQYRNAAKEENREDAWDELEKSVIASVADDVRVGIKGKKADIVIVKKFA